MIVSVDKCRLSQTLHRMDLEYERASEIVKQIVERFKRESHVFWSKKGRNAENDSGESYQIAFNKLIQAGFIGRFKINHWQYCDKTGRRGDIYVTFEEALYPTRSEPKERYKALIADLDKLVLDVQDLRSQNQTKSTRDRINRRMKRFDSIIQQAAKFNFNQQIGGNRLNYREKLLLKYQPLLTGSAQ